MIDDEFSVQDGLSMANKLQGAGFEVNLFLRRREYQVGRPGGPRLRREYAEITVACTGRSLDEITALRDKIKELGFAVEYRYGDLVLVES